MFLDQEFTEYVTDLMIIGVDRGTWSLQLAEKRSRLRQGRLSGRRGRIYRSIGPELPFSKHQSGIHQCGHGYVRSG